MATLAWWTYSSAFKAKVAVAAHKGEKKYAKLTQQNEVYPNRITGWNARLAEGGEGLFGASAFGAEPAAAVDLNVLYAKIGALTLKNEFLRGVLKKAGLLSAKR